MAANLNRIDPQQGRERHSRARARPYRIHAVVNHNRPGPAALSEALDSLEHLDSIIRDAFGKIHARIGHLRNEIDAINGRIEPCKEKIKILKEGGSKRATTVFSWNKYPGSQARGELECSLDPSTIGKVGETIGQNGLVLYQNECVNGKRVNTLELFNEIVEQHGAQTGTIKSIKQIIEKEESGLGRLPDNLPSLGSMFLFNSEENPYNNYTTMDNLVGWILAKERQPTMPKDENKLGDAPLTLGESFDVRFVDGIKGLAFNPTLDKKSLPMLDLPDLDLPNVAADLTLNMGDIADVSIAPSNAMIDQIPDDILSQLPAMAPPSRTAPKEDHKVNPGPNESQFSQEDAIPSNRVAGEATPVGPPGNARPPTVPAGTSMPPAPDVNLPPPSSPQPETRASIMPPVSRVSPEPQKEKEIPTPVSESTGEGRSDLLASIRNFKGKKKLRKTKRNAKNKKAKAATSASNSGSLMDMLRAKLARHRAAISGNEVSGESKKKMSVSQIPNFKITRLPSKSKTSIDDDLKHRSGIPEIISEHSVNEKGTATRTKSFDTTNEDDDGWESA